MTAAQWEITPPPAPDPSAPPPPDAEPVDPSAAAPAAPAVSEWTDADVAILLDVIRGPYDKLAVTTDDDAYRLTKLDELGLVTALTSWMPVSWIRTGQRGQLPLIVALPFSIAVLAAVNLPRLGHWNATHPEARIEIPIPFTKLRIGGGNGRTAPARPRPTASDAGEPRGDDQPGRGGEGGGAAADDLPPAPAGTAAVDGGPPADSLDDIRRGYSL